MEWQYVSSTSTYYGEQDSRSLLISRAPFSSPTHRTSNPPLFYQISRGPSFGFPLNSQCTRWSTFELEEQPPCLSSGQAVLLLHLNAI
ncbi:hypothetical protein GDO81_002701 [Engystomops pustulosus]|uniref:Uncharacterized protein n=1 Tax=Engystomops pustulosus TaxID=76066 RepID=A0AAV7DRF6_ENGPU|nr:hypothetical protein GDO81_002701 [Engystomops pustulosus]